MTESRIQADFDDLASKFADYESTLRGFVRYQVVRQNLLPHVKRDRTLDVLDVGGGSGTDSLWLAKLGHDVTLLEISARQIELAEKRFVDNLTLAERQHITVAPGTIQNLPPEEQDFDLALVHGVAMYQNHPKLFLAKVLERLKPGGLLSLLEKNYYGSEARIIREGDFQALNQLHHGRTVTNRLGRNVHAFKPELLEKALDSLGCDVLQWGGVRVICDDMPEKTADFSPEELKAILRAEYKEGNHPGIRAHGQLVHFIARKR